MKIEQSGWSAGGWSELEANPDIDLVFVFGSRALLERQDLLGDIRDAYAGATVVGCSTAGEICGTKVSDDTLSVTAVAFEHTEIATAEVAVTSSSLEAGERLAARLPADGLTHIFVLSDGLEVNGSDLARGMASVLPPEVAVTGGLSGDGDKFGKTVVIGGDKAVSGRVSAIGFYGDRLEVGYGSLGGWDPFGPERLITRSEGNVLFELDNRSALSLYKRYLGEHAAGLPATGLLFPLALRAPDRELAIVRTILAVDEDHGSMTFAGDLPEGWFARLMRANFDRLVDGAQGAARSCFARTTGEPPDLALLVSCVGRKMVLRQRVEEEVEAVRHVLGESTALTGFYSYGEISPLQSSTRCELHNQTMTITTLSER